MFCCRQSQFYTCVFVQWFCSRLLLGALIILFFGVLDDFASGVDCWVKMLVDVWSIVWQMFGSSLGRFLVICFIDFWSKCWEMFGPYLS